MQLENQHRSTLSEPAPSAQPPSGRQWWHSVDVEGWRLVAHVDRGRVRLLRDDKLDVTRQLAPIARALSSLGIRRAIIDGKLASVSPSGTTSLSRLEHALSRRELESVRYFVFDLLEEGDLDLRRVPHAERRQRLARLLQGRLEPVRHLDYVTGGGADVLSHACALGASAVLSWRAASASEWTITRCASKLVRAQPLPVPAAVPPRSERGRAVVGGVSISNAERVLYPASGIKKLDLARYYERVAPLMLPHVIGRPLTLVRCEPDIAHCKYLRHARAWGPPALRRYRIPEKQKVGEYLVIENALGLVSLAQMDIVEIHTWNSTVDDLERPNRIVLDLDPGPEVSWREVVTAARAIRQLLLGLDLESFVKTTGGMGLHVVVPLVPELDWAESWAFSRAIALQLVRQKPDRYTTRTSRLGRARKILIDHLRNNRGNTSVAAFSTRARPGAPISLPIAWRDLDPERAPTEIRLELACTRRFESEPDPWRAYFQTAQRVTRWPGRERAADADDTSSSLP